MQIKSELLLVPQTRTRTSGAQPLDSVHLKLEHQVQQPVLKTWFSVKSYGIAFYFILILLIIIFTCFVFLSLSSRTELSATFVL